MFSNKTLKYFRSSLKKVDQLTGKERLVLLDRLKLKTLENIGKSMGLTEGRIRQIEKDALKKLRSNRKQLTLFKKAN